MTINEDRTMVGSLGEKMCVTSGMAIASLKHFFFPITWCRLYEPETTLYTFQTFYAISNYYPLISAHPHLKESYNSNKHLGIYLNFYVSLTKLQENLEKHSATMKAV